MRILVFILIGAALGIALGWYLAPRMPVPRGDREALLRQRAAEYYAASRRLDKWTMVRLYTPARQLDETAALKKEATEAATILERQSPEARKEQERTAAGITPAELEVEVEGNWAVVSGKYTLIAFDQEIPAQLDRTLWVFDAGQWWLYDWKIVERNAYGHPPDFAMNMDPLK